MAAMAEFPELVRATFLNDDVNDEGIYNVRLFIRGKPWTITIDDHLLFDDDYDGNGLNWLVFASTSEDQRSIWGALLEKAWAKIYGSYQRIEAGGIGEAFTTLTGAPTQMLTHEDFAENPDKLWKFLETADARGYMMSTAVASGQEAQYDSKGN